MPTIELSMIVKNGAHCLERCLRSVPGSVHRVVIGDTGSTDNTVEIARAHGAEVMHVPWSSDFAAARNTVLARAQCDWVLVLDADEMLEPNAPDLLHGLTSDSATAAWNMRRLNYVADLDVRANGQQPVRNSASIEEAKSYPAYFTSLHTRLFRRDSRIVFEHNVHETVAYSVDRAGLLRRDCGLRIHHFGYVEDAPQAREAKLAYYHELGLRRIAPGSKDARAYLEVGISFLDYARDPAAAQSYLEKSAGIDASSPSVWLYLGLCATRLGRLDEAHARLSRSAGMAPGNSLTWCALGDVYFQQQLYAAATEAYRQAVSLGDISKLTQAKLGSALVKTGNAGKGLKLVRAAVEATADSGVGGVELLRILATSAAAAGEMALACEAAQRCVENDSATAFDFLLAATLYLRASEVESAKAMADAGLQRFPDDGALRQVLAAAVAAAFPAGLSIS